MTVTIMSLSTVVRVHLPKLTHESSFAISQTEEVCLSKSIIEDAEEVSLFFNGGPSFALLGDRTFGWVRGFLTSKSIGGASLTSFLHQVCIFTMKLELARYLQTTLRQIRSISTTGINNYTIFIVYWKNSTFIQQTVISV